MRVRRQMCGRIEEPWRRVCLCERARYCVAMNATAEQLDHFLSEADPATARTVEQIVKGLLSMHAKGAGARWPVRYQLPVRSLGARPELDITKLAHAD